MVAIIIIIIVLIVAAIVVVQSVINKGVYRAKQTVLGGAGLDHQTICDKVISGPLHNKALAQMQADNPYATAELVESRFVGVVNAVMTGAPVAGVPSTMIDKIRNNGKFSHLKMVYIQRRDLSITVRVQCMPRLCLWKVRISGYYT